ncbi:hypothetical protein L1887_32746 [Cichorium endivia]|nr:hypothetical protein L1887_32746 [Cichorium endivia]
MKRFIKLFFQISSFLHYSSIISIFCYTATEFLPFMGLSYSSFFRIPVFSCFCHTNNVVFLGEGSTNTKITGNKNYVDEVSAFHTATVG